MTNDALETLIKIIHVIWLDIS